MAEIALSAGIRTNLSSLQGTSQLLGKVQERLSTGRKVNSAIDNPTNFFAAANLNDRAASLEARLDGMGQAVSTLKAADNALTAMRGIVSAMKGVVDEALSQSDSSDRAASGKQFNELLSQLGSFAKDASYKGVNLLKSAQSDRTTGGTETLTVQFNESFDESTLTIKGINVQGATGSGTSGLAVDSNGGNRRRFGHLWRSPDEHGWLLCRPALRHHPERGWFWPGGRFRRVQQHGQPCGGGHPFR